MRHAAPNPQSWKFESPRHSEIGFPYYSVACSLTLNLEKNWNFGVSCFFVLHARTRSHTTTARQPAAAREPGTANTGQSKVRSVAVCRLRNLTHVNNSLCGGEQVDVFSAVWEKYALPLCAAATAVQRSRRGDFKVMLPPEPCKRMLRASSHVGDVFVRTSS